MSGLTPVPQPDALIDKRGGVTTTFYKFLTSISDGINSAVAGIANVSFLTNQRDVLTITSPLNQDYQIEIESPFAYSITKITTVCTAGTCTLTFKIAGVAFRRWRKFSQHHQEHQDTLRARMLWPWEMPWWRPSARTQAAPT